MLQWFEKTSWSLSHERLKQTIAYHVFALFGKPPKAFALSCFIDRLYHGGGLLWSIVLSYIENWLTADQKPARYLLESNQQNITILISILF